MSFEVDKVVRTLSFVVTVKTLAGGDEIDFRVSVAKDDDQLSGSVEFESLPFDINAIDAVIEALSKARDRVESFEHGVEE